MQTPTWSSGNILNMGSEDPNSFNREAVGQSCIRAPKRRKNDGPLCHLVPRDDFQEDGSGEILKDGYRWLRYDKSNIEEDTPLCRSYICTNPRCSMKIELDKISLYPEKLLMNYVGAHTHGDLPPPYVAPEATTTYVAVNNSGLTVPGQGFPTGQQLNLQGLIDFLKPVFGIFLQEPSKLEFWSNKDPADGSLMNPSLPQWSIDGGPDHVSFPTDNVVQSPLHSNGFCNPQLAMQLQQENNEAAFHSIDAEPEHPTSIQFESPMMAGGEFISKGKTVLDAQYTHELVQQQQQQQEGVAEYQSDVDPLHINENVQYFGIHDSDPGAAVGDIINFQSNAEALPNAETLQSLRNLDATEDIDLQYQSLIDSIQYNETLQFFNMQDQILGAYEDINLMQHLLHDGQNAGNQTTFIPLTCEQPSTSLVAGGGDINSGVLHIAPPQLPYTHQYTQESSFMPLSHGEGLVPP